MPDGSAQPASADAADRRTADTAAPGETNHSADALRDPRLDRALGCVQSGNYGEARDLYQQLLDEGVEDPDLLNNLAVVCGQLGEWQQQADLLSQLLAVQPDRLDARQNLGVALLNLEQPDQALAVFAEVLAADSGRAEAHRGLGRACLLLHRDEQALAALQAALAIEPDHVTCWRLLGQAQRRMGDDAAAWPCLRRAVELEPGGTEQLAAFTELAKAAGRTDEAHALLAQLVGDRPDTPALLLHLAQELQSVGRSDEALTYLLHAVSLEPNEPKPYVLAGLSLLKMGELQQAEELFAKAEALDPADTAAINLLGICHAECGRSTQAIACYDKALALEPGNLAVTTNLASAHRGCGNLDQAIEVGKDAYALDPACSDAVHGLMFSYSIGSAELAAPALQLAAEYWRRLQESSPPPSRALAAAAPQPHEQGRLRIGFLSAEIGSHVVGRFLESFLSHYDRSRFSVELISVARRYEEKALELARYADALHSLQGMEAQVARQFLVDRQYDLLVETSGFTRSSGLDLLAHRCAPVQCHYIGFHASTGLDSIDYFIGDAETADPAFQDQFSERLWPLPRPWLTYSLQGDLPDPASIALTERPILGSFNQLAKVRAETLAYWGAAMAALPDSLLVVKDRHCVDEEVCQRVFRGLQPWGVTADRLRFIPHMGSHREHLECYKTIDIALDATPWSSATTGFEALLMGVPLVAIRGDCLSARMSSSLVKGVGRPDLVAENPSDYAAIVKDLAADLPTLRAGKPHRQQRMLASPLCDAADLAAHLGDGFLAMAARAGIQPA